MVWWNKEEMRDAHSDGHDTYSWYFFFFFIFHFVCFAVEDLQHHWTLTSTIPLSLIQKPIILSASNLSTTINSSCCFDLLIKSQSQAIITTNFFPREERKAMKGILVASVVLLLLRVLIVAAAETQLGLGALHLPSSTVPAFLWSSHYHHQMSETVDYRTISQKDLAELVLSEGEWSKLLCPSDEVQQPVDLALVLIGRELQSLDLSRNKHADPALMNLLRASFEKSNFSMSFPFVAPSEEKTTMESHLISGFRETCGHGLKVNNIAILDSCSVGGGDFQKLANAQSVHNYLVSRMETRQKGQTDLIVFCSGSSDSSEEFDLLSEGEAFSNLISSVEQSGAAYSALYASDPYKSMSSYRTLDRFLAEGDNTTTYCDGVCQIKSSFLEGILVAIVLLIILISGLCCMMGIDTPTRFEAPKES